MTDRWKLLGHRQQVLLARTVASRRRRELLELPNVVSVGWGRRVEDGNLTEEVCVRVRVQKKWKTRARRPDSIPEQLSTLAEVRGVRCQVWVPCDVEEIRDGQPQASAGGTRCKARRPDGAEIRGLGTCRVHRRGKPEHGYLLGCDHVLALSKNYPLPTDPQASGIRTYLGGDHVGRLVELGEQADAAICAVEIDALVDPTVRVRAADEAFNGYLADVDYLPFSYRIPVRTEAGHYTVVQASWVDTQVDRSFGGYSTGSRTFPITIESHTDVELWGGTSGAPLIDDNNRLLGMHFWGAGHRAFALPISAIFSAFDPPVTLSS